tara:strand:- start:578 stop:682 length:105 start_codon:yes stop_codon:yes gene_type:complete
MVTSRASAVMTGGSEINATGFQVDDKLILLNGKS